MSVAHVPPSSTPLRAVAGFEATGYAWCGGEIVWFGDQARTDHPRNLNRSWRPPPFVADAARLPLGARLALQLLRAERRGTCIAASGLLLWLAGEPLAFPLQAAAARFDALRDALVRDDVEAFGEAALPVLGLGPGLTPSGDDFLGGIFFALAHVPRPRWSARMAALHGSIQRACARATNVISAVLLGDLMQGIGYSALHEMLYALQGGAPKAIVEAAAELQRIGASSGSDLLAGLLLALATTPESMPNS